MRGKGSRLGEPCPKVRLSQDRLPIEPFHHMISKLRGKGGVVTMTTGQNMSQCMCIVDQCPKSTSVNIRPVATS